MGPVSLVVSRQQKIDFAPTASMAVLGEKLGTDTQINQSVCCALCREPPFLGAMTLLNSVDDYMKGCYVLTVRDTYGLGPYVDLAWDECGVLVGLLLQGVQRFESPQLSNMSKHLFVAVSS
jgi:hypothetical protein